MKPTVVLAIASLLFIAACRGGEQAIAAEQQTNTPVAEAAAAPISDVDPCKLVSREDMGVMFGELKEGPAASTGLRNERQCNYTNMDGSWIKFSLYAGQERWEWEKGITNAQSPRDVGGLGDEAFAIKRGTDSVVYVRKGESIFELSCSCDSNNAEAIARVAAKNL